MNYIELINQFWQCHKEDPFTPNEIAVYFAILDTCNELRWKVPFNQSNRRFAAKCNISEPTFIRVRQVIKERGLIDYKSEPGRRHNTVYVIKHLKDLSINGTVYRTVSDSINGTVSGMVYDEKFLHYNKHTKLNINETKDNPETDVSGHGENSFSSPIDNLRQPEKPPPKKPAHPAYTRMVEHWMKVVRPGWEFTAVDGRKIKAVIKRLEKRFQANGEEASPEKVVDMWQAVCGYLPETWYRDKSLSKIESGFDEILEFIKSKLNGTAPGSNSPRNYPGDSKYRS